MNLIIIGNVDFVDNRENSDFCEIRFGLVKI